MTRDPSEFLGMTNGGTDGGTKETADPGAAHKSLLLLVGVTGFEPEATPPNPAENAKISGDAAQNPAQPPATPQPSYQTSADLAEVVRAWPTLPTALRAAIMALIKTHE